MHGNHQAPCGVRMRGEERVIIVIVKREGRRMGITD
jgi:hypothetical protein